MHHFNFPFYLPPEEIHVWLINTHNIATNDFIISHAKKLINLNFVSIKKKFENSRESLCYLLSCYLKIAPEELQLEKTIRGKPILLNHPEISFSMSHSGEVLVLAFARHPVGIDLEKKRSVKAAAIAQKFFAAHECDFLKRSAEEQFFNLWTAKEAALKADGCGITEGLRQALTTIEENFVTGIYLKDRYLNVTPWLLSSNSNSFPCFFGSVASFFSPSLIRWYALQTADSLAG